MHSAHVGPAQSTNGSRQGQPVLPTGGLKPSMNGILCSKAAFRANQEKDSSQHLEGSMKIRRMVLDVDKAIARPTVIEIGAAIEAAPNVEGLNITVTEIDIETVGMDITIEGEGLDYDDVVKAIESTGAVVHSIDELVSGSRLVERITRSR